MRTETASTNRTSTVDRMRAELGRARKRFKAQPTAVRWAVGLAAITAIVALTYATTGTPAPSGSFVRSGERFAADDRIAVTNALDRLHIRYQVDRQGRIEIAVAQLDAANDAVAKLGVGPRTFSEIEGSLTASPWDSPTAALQRQERATCAKLEEMIRPIDGVISAHVLLNRPRGPRSFRAPTPATAFVYVEAEQDRKLTDETVEAIQNLIAGAVPEIKHDAVSVFDRKGRHYLDATNGSIGAETRLRQRRDQLRQEILDRLEWLKGATVSVQLLAPNPPVVAALAQPVLPPPAATVPPSTPTLPPPAPVDLAPTPPPLPALPPLSMRVNEPLDLALENSEPPPASALAPAPAPTPPPVPATIAASSVEPVAPSLPPKARVLVMVPRSFYLRAVSGRERTLDDLQPFVERTKGLIETTIRHVVPPGQLEEPIVISTIPDEAPARAETATAPPSSGEARRLVLWWVPAAAAAVAALIGGLTVAFVMAARRPALRAATPPREAPGRYKIDEAADVDPGPGPSERVRELIRQNPEAAASVLHRWTGQGGTIG